LRPTGAEKRIVSGVESFRFSTNLQNAKRDEGGFFRGGVSELLTPFVKNDDTKLSHAICFAACLDRTAPNESARFGHTLVQRVSLVGQGAKKGFLNRLE